MSEPALARVPPQRDIRLPQRAWTEADLLNGRLTVSSPREEPHQGIGAHTVADLLAAATGTEPFPVTVAAATWSTPIEWCA